MAAAEFAQERDLGDTSDFILAYADWLSDHLEEWTVTTRGDLVPGRSRHYVRITPADPLAPDPHPDPDSLVLLVANGGGYHPARNVVGGDFLHLVRLGIRPADDPVILESLEVIDRVIKRDLPQGPGWRRYNHDGYGQKSDGGPFDGGGVGRSWPILTGERGHYELAAGRDPMPYIKAMEEFANDGGMISEQLWDDAPSGEHLRPGCPTGAAMPLCWSHAEYVSLVRSRNDGVCFDLLPPVRDRYVIRRTHGRHEIWSFRHPLRHMHDGKTLRIVLNAGARVVWSLDGWQSTQETETTRNEALACGMWTFPPLTFMSAAQQSSRSTGWRPTTGKGTIAGWKWSDFCLTSPLLLFLHEHPHLSHSPRCHDPHGRGPVCRLHQCPPLGPGAGAGPPALHPAGERKPHRRLCLAAGPHDGNRPHPGPAPWTGGAASGRSARNLARPLGGDDPPEVEAKYPEEAAAWEEDPFTFAPPGGESGLAVTARSLPALMDILHAHPSGNVAIVSHKATIRLLLSSLLGFDPRRYRDNLDQSPAALNIVDFKSPVRARLTLFNDTSHYESAGLAIPPFPGERLSGWWAGTDQNRQM